MSRLLKVVCINNEEKNDILCDLTLNKIYESHYYDGISYLLKGNNGFYHFYSSNRFITLAEWREKQINSILDE